jgi:hypothetical protein
VVDFSTWSKDDLSKLFSNLPFNVCGRLKQSQQENILLENNPAYHRNTIQKIAPLAAASLLAIHVEANDTNTISKKEKNIEKNYYFKGSNESHLPIDSTVIEGYVKDDSSKPLVGAQVTFGEIVATTNNLGQYKFVLSNKELKAGTIKFSFENLVPEARSYNPAMGSTSFDIILNRIQQPHYSGGISPEIEISYSISAIESKFIKKLDANTTKILDKLALTLKENPSLNINVSSEYFRYKNVALKLSKLAVNYLANQQGISNDRIQVLEPAVSRNKNSNIVVNFSTQH